MQKDNVPTHIGIIMDGNGRWAKKRGLPRKMGHKQGAKVFEEMAKYCSELGVKYLTVYVFSTENWNRPDDEIQAIMDLLSKYLDEAIKNENEDKGIVLRFIGDTTCLRSDLREKIEYIENHVNKSGKITVNIALNYGGRDEIIVATKRLIERVLSGKMTLEQVDIQAMEQCLYTAGQPDPDLIIRPSGEYRLSNFLLWQMAYSELVFMDVLWPDFTKRDLDKAILEYQERDRRYGTSS